MKPGRPKKAKSERKVSITGVRLKSDERAIVERAASIEGKTLSDWIRETLLNAARE
jgi:uncharacterized protein (DUF1778 family)